MKSGISLVEMAKEIQRQAELKADYVMDTRSLRLEPFGSDLYLNAYTPSGEMAVEPLEINAIAHRQIGTHLKIPAAYYDKMLTQHPQLLSENVNAWFEREPAVRLVRTIGGTARAFLSNRYRRIDNLDIAGIVLPVLQDMEGMHFESCQLTESRMYIKVVNTRLQAEVSPGDIVQSGIIISNSEVGLGSVNIQPLVYRLVCSNGMVVNDAQTRRNHVGRVNEATENYQLFPMFFAFNKQQFAEGMRTLGLSLSDTCQMCSIFGGGYCRKSDAAKLGEMLARHRKELEDAISSDKTGKGFIFDMFLQELENHEYSYTGDVQEALDALGITPQYMEAMPQLMTGLSLACNKAMQHDCFG